MSLFNYAPDEVNVIVAGIIPLQGFVDGTFIKVTKDVVPFSTRVSTDGFVSRVYNNSQTYTVEITLSSGSQANDVLTKLWYLDEITQKAKFPLLIRDSSGTDLFFSTTTWVQQPPDMVKSTSIDDRTWTLRCTGSGINIGGNERASSLVEDLANAAIASLPILEGIL